MPVEALFPGLRVIGTAGEPVPVAWLGVRRIDPRRHPHPDWVQPIRIRRGAIGNALPRRDVDASGALNLWLGGLAIPLQALVNGATVVAAGGIEAAEFHHVELVRPGTLLAEGLAVESYRDRGDRTAFGNAGAVMLLHPGEPGLQAGEDEAPVRELRRRLLQRAQALGFAVTRDSGLHLRADGWPIAPSVIVGSSHGFVLPPDAADVRIISRAGVPAEIDPTSSDRRRLGVMVEQIVLRGPRGETRIAPEDPVLSEGFHPPERSGSRAWRWTDGHARLPAGLLAGATRLEVHVGGFQPAWAGTAPPGAPVTRSA